MELTLTPLLAVLGGTIYLSTNILKRLINAIDILLYFIVIGTIIVISSCMPLYSCPGAQDVFIDLLGRQRLPALVVAEEPEPRRPVVLVVGDRQVLSPLRTH